MGRRGVDALLLSAVAGAAFAVWLAGLGFAAAGLALDRPPCIRSHLGCGSVTSSWSWFPPGTRYEWLDADGREQSATDPWAFSAVDTWAWTAIVAALCALTMVAILRRTHPTMDRPRRSRTRPEHT